MTSESPSEEAPAARPAQRRNLRFAERQQQLRAGRTAAADEAEAWSVACVAGSILFWLVPVVFGVAVWLGRSYETRGLAPVVGCVSLVLLAASIIVLWIGLATRGERRGVVLAGISMVFALLAVVRILWAIWRFNQR